MQQLRANKVCDICGQEYTPDIRNYKSQKYCHSPECIRKRDALQQQKIRDNWSDYRRQRATLYMKQWREKQPDFNITHSAYTRAERLRLRNQVLAAYGGKCACCGESIAEFLAIDHINGGGSKHRRREGFSSSTQIYRWLRKNGFPEGYRILCHNCNCARGWYGRCPHEGGE